MSDDSRPLGLYTDLYELRMVESYLRAGMTADATFSLYIRPARARPWFIALGVFRVLEVLAGFRYEPRELDYLASIGVNAETLGYLGSLSPSGEVWAVADGTLVLGDEPIVEITAPLPFAQLIETAVINVVHYATLVATKAARVALAAKGRAVVDFGFRRAHGLETGVDAALAANVGGGLTTSNVEAGRRYGIPVVGTMAHSFVQAHPTELDAFRAFAEDHPDGTTLLVDTYDTLGGVRNAVVVARELKGRGGRLRAIRLDSGDIGALAHDARRILDDGGLPDVEIFASGGLDEYDIAALVDAGAPIDGFGVGTDLVTSSDRPAVDIAYKLVAYDGRPVAKFSPDKVSLPGAKQVFRVGDPSGDVLALRDEKGGGRQLLSCVWQDGDPLYAFDRDAAREIAAEDLRSLDATLARPVRDIDPPRPVVTEELRRLADSGRPTA